MDEEHGRRGGLKLVGPKSYSFEAVATIRWTKFGKIIPVIGVSRAPAIAGLSLIGVTLYFVIVMRDVAMFRRSVREIV